MTTATGSSVSRNCVVQLVIMMLNVSVMKDGAKQLSSVQECRLRGGMMPFQPDFDQMQLAHLEELTPYFKRYGITRTAPNASGKHKKKRY